MKHHHRHLLLISALSILATTCTAASRPAVLIEKLENGSDQERYEAAVLLARTEGETDALKQTQRALVKALQHDESTPVRCAAAVALAKLDARYPDTAKSMVFALLFAKILSSDSNFDVKVSTALALGMLSDQSLPPQLLCTAAIDADKEVRKAAMLGLGRCDCDAARLFLQLQASVDPDTEINTLAISSLAKHQQKAVTNLIAVLDDLNSVPDARPAVRNATISALRQITGQDFGSAHKEWSRWWSRTLEKQKQKRSPLETNWSASATQLPKNLTVDCGGGVKMEFVLIPAGDFIMGLGFKSGSHKVTLTKPFYMSKFEVTQAQWEAVMNSNPSEKKGVDRPAEGLSWDDCQNLCRKLSQSRTYTFRLPTEAEWEYACRAGTTNDFSFGGSDERENAKLAKDHAWYITNSEDKTHRVGSKKSNPWGLHDMHGNVAEWCQDYWRANYQPKHQVDPTGPTSGEARILRGGSYRQGLSSLLCTTRGSTWASNRHSSFGCRLVLEPK